LHLDGAFRREVDRGAVEMGLEGDAVLADPAELGERHHLKAARVGQDRPFPMHECVQPTKLGDAFGAGAQHQMIGVAENDVGAGGGNVLGEHRFYRGAGADRHEGRRADQPAWRHDNAGPRRAIMGLNGELKRLSHAPAPG
jgi:hypothetical protein